MPSNCMNRKTDFFLSFTLTLVTFVALGVLFDPLFEMLFVVVLYLISILIIAALSYRYYSRSFCYGFLSGLILIIAFGVSAVLIASQIH